MSKLFHFTLSTPEAVLFDGEAEMVTFDTTQGEVGVMADHAPMVALISPGVMTIKGRGENKTLASGGGFIKVGKNRAEAFTQTAEFAESIDEKRAVEAQKQAQAVMAEAADEVSLADATALLERNIARIRALERKKRRSHR